jgi:hypothetical protein
MCTVIFTINITSSYMFQFRWVIFRENSYLHITVLPDNDPVGLKHVGGSNINREYNNTHCAFVGGLLHLYEVVHGHGAY